MRDPLLQFILLGIAIFVLHRMVSEDTGTVQITAEQVAAAEADFTRRAGRAPDETERAQVLDTLITEEVLYQEGRSLSLEAADPILRRRVIARMRLLLAATAPPQPSDAELAALLAENPARYQRLTRLSLRHVFLDAARHHSTVDALRRAEAELLAGADPATVGDPFLHGRSMVGAGEDVLAERFGEDFAAEVLTLPQGGWWPVRSRYGEHLVYIDAIEAARPSTVEEARAALTADWQQQARAEAEAAALTTIRSRYRVVTP